MSQAPPRGVLATLCLTVTVSYGVLYYAFAVLGPAITVDTGWSLTAITAAFSLGMLTAGMAGIAVGRVIQARGPRLVMVTGGLVGGAGLLALAGAPTYPTFVIAMLVCGVGAAGLFYPPAFATITHWHGARRVRALTALTLVAGLASTIFAPVTTFLADLMSWRTVYVVFAALLLVVAVPAHLIALNHPWRVETERAGKAPDRDVLTSGPFVLAAIGGTLITLVMYASLIALIPLLVGRGMSPALGAWALGLGGAGQVAGRLLYPRLTAVMGLRARVTVVSGGIAATLAALAVIPGPEAVLIGVSILAGAARGLFTLVNATLVSDVWGPERYAAINGVLSAPLTAAGAVGPFAGAWIAETAGGYPTAFALFAVIAGLGTVLLSRAIRRAPRHPVRPSEVGNA